MIVYKVNFSTHDFITHSVFQLELLASAVSPEILDIITAPLNLFFNLKEKTFSQEINVFLEAAYQYLKKHELPQNNKPQKHVACQRACTLISLILPPKISFSKDLLYHGEEAAGFLTVYSQALQNSTEVGPMFTQPLHSVTPFSEGGSDVRGIFWKSFYLLFLVAVIGISRFYLCCI